MYPYQSVSEFDDEFLRELNEGKTQYAAKNLEDDSFAQIGHYPGESVRPPYDRYDDGNPGYPHDKRDHGKPGHPHDKHEHGKSGHPHDKHEHEKPGYSPYRPEYGKPGHHVPEYNPRDIFDSKSLGTPPSYTPKKNLEVYKVDPGSIRHCTGKYTYIWINNGSGFWMYPTYIGRQSIAGYRWTGFGWVYFGMDLDNIDSFYCV